MSRSRILHRIRCIRSAARPSDSPELPSSPPPLPKFSHPVREFIRQSEQLGATAHVAANLDSFAAILAGVLSEVSIEELFWESPEIFWKHRLPFRFRDPAGFGEGRLMTSFHFRKKVKFPLVINTRPYRRAALPGIEMVTLHADWGVAETGTLGLQVRPGKGRMLPVLPPQVLVLVRARDIASNLRQVLERAEIDEVGSILTLVSGPSRTADIEKTLVIGVHGPKRVFVVVTDFGD